MNVPTTREDVIYHGVQLPAGGSAIEVESLEGQVLGVVHHVIYHSPTGMGWGYAGSGAADCARSLLIAALGDNEALCKLCNGTRKVVYDEGAAREIPYDHTRADAYDPELVMSCMHQCSDGYRDLPYMDFKFQVVAGLSREWRMRRAEILAWLQAHEMG